MTTPIPQPRTIPFLGNVTSIDTEVPLRGFILLAKQFGEIYQLDILGSISVNLNSNALINEVSDEKRFRKAVGGALYNVRDLVGDGLFTAMEGEPNWGIAHRLLMPAFGTLSIRGMMEDMRDICSQLFLKWERFGPEYIIDPVDDFTRVTLDTLAFCCMSYRLNSFYTEHTPPFSTSMADFLSATFVRSSRPALIQAMKTSENAKYEADIKLMKDLATKIVADRKANPTEKKDILNIMLNGRDPKTGEGLSDESIINNLLTFMIAGHETSSGMLSFTTYYLIKHPRAMRKLQKEVDDILNGRPMKPEDLGNMPYLVAVMRESLRLSPTASQRGVFSLEDTTLLNGKYFIKKGTRLVCQEWLNHRDPVVWGNDAEEFKPERMLDGKFEALPPNAWQPFGYGMRGCIGRPFAWQEVALILASMIQKFDLELADPSYTLIIKQSLTIKPKNFYIKARLRKTGPPLQTSLTPVPSQTLAGEAGSSTITASKGSIPLYLLYGSNTGTSETFAQRVANDAARHGFKAKLDNMDSFTGALPPDGPVIVFTASYEGQPADNAARFIDWLTNIEGEELKGVRFGVFGCGNSDWAQTLQRIPRLCDDLMEKRGGKRLLPRGEADSGKGDFFEVYEGFVASLWATLEKEYNVQKSDAPASSGLEVRTVTPGTQRAVALRQPGVGLGKVFENIVLTKPGHPVKRHIEFELPEGTSYRTGDYLAILPRNPESVVRRVLALFGLPSEQEVIISSSGPTPLPTDKAVSIAEVLAGYVELSQPATTHDIRTLTECATADATRSALQELSASYQDKVLGPRLSVFDILETYKNDVKVGLGAFLQMLPPMRVRQYSISSSPLWNPERATLTVSVLESPLKSDSSKTFLGVGSNFLANLKPGDLVQMLVRGSVNFHPPEDITVPIVAFCAGSGLAPIRGFIQERAIQKASGRDVGKILLFFGCRTPEDDFLYAENELKEWKDLGVVDIRPAFSRASDKSVGCKYIQHRLWNDREDVIEAYRNNARFYVCGSNVIAKEVKVGLVEIYKQLHPEKDETTAKVELADLLKGRYATDVFE
uniref:Putative fatty acid hydroxylase n=1 Tax=Moniliophthora roreri TaxID=221103 RepID=A0A0W0F1E3_MONRR